MQEKVTYSDPPSGNRSGVGLSVFSREYWRLAAAEFRSPKVLVFAALMIALRVIFKAVSIPVAADLRINTAFLVNAFGAMVFGPVVAAAAAAVTDTLGCILFPTGPYFFPFIFVEIAGSVIFALFLYRREITAAKVLLSRFCIAFFVNIVLNTPIMMWYYDVMYGKYYAPLDLLRIVKNLALFPLESVVLILFLRAATPPLKKLGYVVSDVSRLKFTRKNIAVLATLTLLGALCVGGYYVYHYNNTSLSAAYTADERAEKNAAVGGIVMERHPEWPLEEMVMIVESALPRFGSDEVTYEVAVYRADTAAVAERAAEGGADMATVRGYSKSKAKADKLLTHVTNVTLVIDGKSGGVVSYTEHE